MSKNTTSNNISNLSLNCHICNERIWQSLEEYYHAFDYNCCTTQWSNSLYCYDCDYIYYTFFHPLCAEKVNESYVKKIGFSYTCEKCTFCCTEKDKIGVTEIDAYYYLLTNYLDKIIDIVGDENEFYLYYGATMEKIKSDEEIKENELRRMNTLCTKMLDNNSLSLEQVVDAIRNEKYVLRTKSGKLTKCAVK